MKLWQLADVNTIFGFWPRRKVDISLDRLKSLMDRHGVVKAVTVSTTAIFYDHRQGNEETLSVCEEEGGLVPVAVLDPREYLHCHEEAEKALSRGVKFFRLFPDIQGWPFDFKPFEEILGALSGKGAVLLVPVQGYGRATQLARALSDRDLRVVMLSVSYFNLGEVISVAKDDPRFFIETRLIDSAAGLEVAAEAIGSGKLLLGTEMPLSYPASAIEVVRGSNLPKKEKAGILGGNLLALLRSE